MEPGPGRPPDPVGVQALRRAVEDALADFADRRGISNPAAYLPLVVAALTDVLAWTACDVAILTTFGDSVLREAFWRIELGEGLTEVEHTALLPLEWRRAALAAKLVEEVRAAFPEAHGADSAPGAGA